MGLKENLSDIKYITVEYNDSTLVFEDYSRGMLYDRAKVKYIKCATTEDFICELAKEKWNDCVDVAKQINNSKMMRTRVRDDKGQKLNIAIYYRCISNGGAQKVTAQLANMLANTKKGNEKYKYNVVLITDADAVQTQSKAIDLVEPEDVFYYELTQSKEIKEYSVDKKVVREYLPSYESAKGEKYKERYRRWQSIIENNHVDIVISGLWIEQTTFWDMLSVKAHPSHPAFIVHSHNFCGVPYLFSDDTAIRLTHMYSMADAVVVLSKIDKTYVSGFASRTFFIHNPTNMSWHEEKIQKDNNMLLWVGRISSEKHPLDAIEMMGYLAPNHPSLKLYIVGDGDQTLIQALITKTKQLGITENVVLVGYKDDVEEYYRKASVFVSTSKYEGFPMTTIEAISCKTPVVEYTKPWLTCSGEEFGIIEVEQGNVKALADAVSRVIDDDAERLKLGEKAFSKYQELLDYDVENAWGKVFETVAYSEKPAMEMDMLLSFLTEYQNSGKLAMRNEISCKATYFETEYRRINLSISYKLGLILTYPVRKIFHLIKDCVVNYM